MDRRARKFLIAVLSAVLLWVVLPGMGYCQDDELLKNPREMTFPPLSFNLPKAERTVLSNGVVVYLLASRPRSVRRRKRRPAPRAAMQEV